MTQAGDSGGILYRIRNWDAHFENNRTRSLKALYWVPIPNSLDGDGYTELLDHEDGAAHYGAWIALLMVASKCSPRGTLIRKSGTQVPESGTQVPHDAHSLARITRVPAGIWHSALHRLVNQIKWVEAIDLKTGELTEIPHDGAGITHPSAGIPHDGAPLEKGMEGNGKKETSTLNDPPFDATDEERADAWNLTAPTGETNGKRNWKLHTFDEFWSVVWMKKGKGDARKKWLTGKDKAEKPLVPDETRARWLILKAKEQGPLIMVDAENRAAPGERPRPLWPGNWLSGERFDDDWTPGRTKADPADKWMEDLK